MSKVLGRHVAVACVLSIVATIGHPQTKPPKMKMTTEIPAEITTPDSQRACRRRTGRRPFPEKAGTCCSGFMAGCSRGSTRAGGSGRSTP